jgi:glutamate-5-semialdehyde dehydrogenase
VINPSLHSMSAPPPAEAGAEGGAADIRLIGQRARAAGQVLAAAPLAARNSVLAAIKAELVEQRDHIVAANAEDLAAAAKCGLDAAVMKVGAGSPPPAAPAVF